MQNIRCLISLDEDYGLFGCGSVSGWDKERRLNHPLPPLMPEMGSDGRLSNKLHTDNYRHNVTVKELFLRTECC
jgi:hypothetical protein